MRKFLWVGMGLCVNWAGCTSPGVGVANAYRPAIIELEVNAPRYEADRQDCEARIQRSLTSYELNDVIRFRRCLVDKGYRLLS